MDARFNKKDLIKRIVRIAQYKNRIDLHNDDALDLVGKLRDTLPAKSLFYFDPPYYVKGKDLYLNYFQYSDHKTIADEISRVNNQKWIVTYDFVPPICDLYKTFRQKKFNLNYSAAKASVGEEVMIFSDNVKIASTPLFCG